MMTMTLMNDGDDGDDDDDIYIYNGEVYVCLSVCNIFAYFIFSHF